MGVQVRVRRIDRRLAAAAAGLVLAWPLTSGNPAGAGGDTGAPRDGVSPTGAPPASLYRAALARGERPPGTATLYRMHTRTGEVCAFMFLAKEAPEPRGCAGPVYAGANATEERFELHVAAGFPGTNRSTAYRVDRTTGVVCRFETAHSPGGPIEAQGCWLGAEKVPADPAKPGAKPGEPALDR